jgi:hypothetical protein
MVLNWQLAPGASAAPVDAEEMTRQLAAFQAALLAGGAGKAVERGKAVTGSSR